ncbi:MAG TPA: MFS transporter [Dongiaceae bacterium]|nr:MFS transporter [Dongiaceae bacterium]
MTSQCDVATADGSEGMSPADCAGGREVARADTRAWLAVLSIAIGAFVMVTSELLPVGLLTDISAGLHVTNGVAGLMMMMPAAVATFAAPIALIAAGRFDRRLVLCSLMALIICSNIVAALAPSFAVVLMGRFLLGICVGGFWTYATATGQRLVPPASASKAIAIVLTGISLGTVCGVPAGALIAEYFGWRAAFATTAVLTGLVLFAQIAFLPRMPGNAEMRLSHLVAPLRYTMARIGLLVSVLIFIGQFASYTYLKAFLQQVSGLDGTLVAILLLVYGLTGVAANFIGEWATARNLKVTMVGIAVVGGLSIPAFNLLSGSAILVSALVAIWGLAFGIIPIAITVWMYKASPDQPEAGQALLVSVVQIALSSGAAIGGRIVDWYGLPATMNFGGLLMWLAAALVLLFIRSAWPTAR